MAALAVFDFDHTIVDQDSDATVIEKLKEKKPPPEWDSTNHDWTPYMNNVFEHACTAGFKQEDILAAIGSMRPTAGMEALLKSLADEGWDVLFVTDANSVFVNHWLKVHGLDEYITSVVTNPASWSHGRLMVQPCMQQCSCALCPNNLCKGLALTQWATSRRYRDVIYAGDGRNDFCPATKLPENAIVFPRRGYPLDDLIKKTLATPTPLVKAKVVPWDDGYRIIQELFPDKHIISC